VTFPESAAVPVVLQPRPTWRGGAPRRVTDSVGDVMGVRRGEPTGSKEPGAPAPSGPGCAAAYCCAPKIAAYQQQYADNQNISFLPAIVSTSTRMHGDFLRLLFLQATEAHFTAAGMSSQTNNSEALRFKRAAFHNGLKSKVGLAAAKAAALRINLNVQGCGIVAPPMHAPSRTPLLLPLLLSHNLPTPRVH
jgi:hypothetical protein